MLILFILSDTDNFVKTWTGQHSGFIFCGSIGTLRWMCLKNILPVNFSKKANLINRRKKKCFFLYITEWYTNFFLFFHLLKPLLLDLCKNIFLVRDVPSETSWSSQSSCHHLRSDAFTCIIIPARTVLHISCWPHFEVTWSSSPSSILSISSDKKNFQLCFDLFSRSVL